MDDTKLLSSSSSPSSSSSSQHEWDDLRYKHHIHNVGTRIVRSCTSVIISTPDVDHAVQKVPLLLLQPPIPPSYRHHDDNNNNHQHSLQKYHDTTRSMQLANQQQQQPQHHQLRRRRRSIPTTTTIQQQQRRRHIPIAAGRWIVVATSMGMILLLIMMMIMMMIVHSDALSTPFKLSQFSRSKTNNQLSHLYRTTIHSVIRSHSHSYHSPFRSIATTLLLSSLPSSPSLSSQEQSVDDEQQSQLRLHLTDETITKKVAITPENNGSSSNSNIDHNDNDMIQRNTVTNFNINNNVDGVIRWKDVLRSPYPLSCDLNDTECLKRQQEMFTSSYSSTVATTTTTTATSTNDDIQQDIEIVLSWKEQRNLLLAVLGTMITIVTMIVQSGPGAYRYYIAGAICATTSHVIPVPIDTVKTRKQVDPKFAKLSFMAALVKIWNQEGMSGLLAGLGPTAIGYALEGGIKFGVYETMKPIVTTGLYHISMISTTYLSFVQSRIVSFAICAAISGVAASIVLCPMESLRIRMVANPKRSPPQHQGTSGGTGWLSTAVQMIKTEGITSFIKGMVPMIYKQVPYTITKNVSFDILTRYVYTTLQTTWQMTTIGPFTKFVVPFLAAVAASILSCLSSQPGDVLLSLVNAQQNDRRRTRDVIRDVLHSEKGWKGFYIGTKARLLHVGIVVTLQLLIYDLVKRTCGIAATGITK